MTDRGQLATSYIYGLEAARKICDTAVLAYRNGAGTAHSAEARSVGEAQAEWIADEIDRLLSHAYGEQTREEK